MKQISVGTSKRKLLMFNQDDFDEVFDAINEKEQISDESYERFFEYFDMMSENLVLSDFPTAEGRARFMMTSMNMMFGDNGEMDIDNAADVVMTMATHLNIAVSHIENKERYNHYLLNEAMNGLR